MGLFSWLFESKAPNDLETGTELGQTKATRLKVTHKTREVSVDGECPTRVYTYIGSIFGSLKKGDSFYADIVEDDVELVSESTGYTFDTKGSDSVALSFGGIPFGTVGASLRVLKWLAKDGIGFRIRVEKTGMYSAGIPNLVAKTMDPNDIADWWLLQRRHEDPVPLDMEYVHELMHEEMSEQARQDLSKKYSFNLPKHFRIAEFKPTRKAWLEGELPCGNREFTPRLKWLPPKKGSKARPHILISDGEVPLIEVAAKDDRIAYAAVAENYENPCTGLIRHYPGEKGAGDVHVVLVFDTHTTELAAQATGDGGAQEQEPPSPRLTRREAV